MRDRKHCGSHILVISALLLGCAETPEISSNSEFHLAMESLGLSHSTLRQSKISSAFYSGPNIAFEIAIDNSIDFSFLQYASLTGSQLENLRDLLDRLETVKQRDGSVCACAFEIDFVLKVETASGQIFDIVADPSHHHVYLFKDSQLKWMGRLSAESWNTLRRESEN